MTQQNKTVVRRLYEEVFNALDTTLLDELVASDVIIHDPMMGELQGIDAFRQFTTVFITAFPQQHTTLEALIAEDDLVAVLHTHTGTHNGSFMGMPPTGKPIKVEGIEFFRVRDGKIIELWRHDDDAGLMRQLGAVPQNTQA